MSTNSASLFDDIFLVLERDPDGKKFDRVSRFKCRSELYECDMTLDLNVDLFPLEKGAKFQMMLASTLDLSGAPGSVKFDGSIPLISNKPSLLDRYDYVMYGKVYKYREAMSNAQLRTEVYASFGGLLMLLIGDPKKLASLEVDAQLYFLVRKV